jgi:hypothetical protein
VLTVVTAIFGPGFALHEPATIWPGCRFLCITDQPLKGRRWEIQLCKKKPNPRRRNRRVKALLHRFVEGPTLYLDSEFQVTEDPRELLGPALERSCWAATRHPQRDCLFDEAAVCIHKRLTESPETLAAQVIRYHEAGMPEHFGLWAGGILARRGDEQSQRLGEAWHSEIENGAERDQVSLPFVAWRLGLPPAEIPGVYTALPGIIRRKRPDK